MCHVPIHVSEQPRDALVVQQGVVHHLPQAQLLCHHVICLQPLCGLGCSHPVQYSLDYISPYVSCVIATGADAEKSKW